SKYSNARTYRYNLTSRGFDPRVRVEPVLARQLVGRKPSTVRSRAGLRDDERGGEMANGEGETAKDEEETANEEEMKRSSWFDSRVRVEPKVERRLVAGKLSSVHVVQIEKEMGELLDEENDRKRCANSSSELEVPAHKWRSSIFGKKTIREAGCPKSKPKIFQSTWYISIMQKGEYVGRGETTVKERSTGYGDVYAENNVEEGCTGCGDDSGNTNTNESLGFERTTDNQKCLVDQNSQMTYRGSEMATISIGKECGDTEYGHKGVTCGRSEVYAYTDIKNFIVGDDAEDEY
ncbi:hypothetical protein F5141DRAFT_1067772, partial [Pisolithus sp. B1]